MPKRKGLIGALKTADDICRLTTGRRLNQVIASAVELFGQEVIDKAPPAADPEEFARTLPYIVLGINSDAPDFLVKAAWKAQRKECNSDAGGAETEKAARINNAYDAICQERGIPK